MDRLQGDTTMRRSRSSSLLLYGTIAALALAVMLTVIIPAITSLGDALHAGVAKVVRGRALAWLAAEPLRACSRHESRLPGSARPCYTSAQYQPQVLNQSS
jgi:hypothetical protein